MGGRVKQEERPPTSFAAAASKEDKGPEMGNSIEVGEKGVVFKTFWLIGKNIEKTS